MASPHRKLLDESIPYVIASLCQQNCDEPEIYNGTCPSYCSITCPPNSCKLPIISFPPPPPPPLPPLAPSTDPVKPHEGISLPLIISLAVLATAFFIFTCYTIYKFYTVWKNSQRRRPRRQSEEEDGGDDFLDADVVDHPIWYIRTIGLQPSVINAITIVKYKSADGLVEGTDCAVCLSEFQEDETLRLLPKCSHAFHIPCIDTWLASHTNCPMCRAGIVTDAAAPIQLQETPDHHIHSEARPDIEGDVAARSQIRVENVEGGDCKIDVDGLQPVRRSVSMDSLSASMISAAVASAFPRQCDKSSQKVEDVRCGSSSSIKRSASCSAKVFLSRHSSRRYNSGEVYSKNRPL